MRDSSTTITTPPSVDHAALVARYTDVRRVTERLCAPLAVEDHVVQAMPDVSPTKWHLAHVSWFFETFLLAAHLPGYRLANPAYQFLFNSYYNAVGPQFSRPDRGYLSRPTVAEIHGYRAHVDGGARLPTEFEWERVAADASLEGHFQERGVFHPLPLQRDGGAPAQLFGDVWQWTGSAYAPYPGYRAQPGAVGEYNGQFMVNQMVLRGGSCVTPRDHIRATYRNFFPPDARWQFSGIRLADDA